MEIASCYAIDVIAGNNIRMNELCAQSVKDYLKSVNVFLIARGFTSLINLDLKKETPALFYENIRVWENEPNRCTHLTPEFLAELLHRAKQKKIGTGLVAVMSDFTILGRYTSAHLSKYG